MKPLKLVVVGVGHVGSYVLADAMKLGFFGKIGVIDLDKGIAYGEALDQSHATALTYMNNIEVTSGGYEQCEDADIIICAAGPSILKDPDHPEAMPDRTLLTTHNAGVIREVMTEITKYTKSAVIIFITNPLDTMVYIAENEFGYPSGKIFGTGTMLDSARLRKTVANLYHIDPKSVTGYMMGEHGMTAFPVLSKLNVAGIVYKELASYYTDIEQLNAEEIGQEVVKTAYDVLNAKGWTNAGVAQAAVTMAKCVALDERSIYPACTTLRGEYGHNGDVAFSMPCLIGKDGIIRRIAPELDDWETKKLNESIDYIQSTMKEAKTGPGFLKK
ncbi:lactate dehydrogenase [Clostridium carboxidivorans P7]|uniref:Lactate/malate dehydrogenase n=1 Tax=Clostridium carboxidivorans P7 TaxID=536227 RepID=C6PQN3_9CLOT|nr:lactate dehydrogenase [Clostridium carboxidivorans]AKN34059.1 lactate dehydrogenase [Clostridium carboxidivorans P7]EET88405.1 Lactate/malate dehydrogenase [Clostridium carboxidivorans P7]EFG88066.1 lactate/malate dehydrogenase, NAD binding domain protein [Clostridium carboxidivorans P7]